MTAFVKHVSQETACNQQIIIFPKERIIQRENNSPFPLPEK